VAASNHSWTISDVGHSAGPSSGDRHKPDGQIDVPFTVTARQDIAYEHDFHKLADVNGAPARVDVADPDPVCSVPSPFAGDPGQPIDFASVAPDFEEPSPVDYDGSGAPAASDSSAAAPGVPS
jgi:hypothetical protein